MLTKEDIQKYDKFMTVDPDYKADSGLIEKLAPYIVQHMIESRNG